MSHHEFIIVKTTVPKHLLSTIEIEALQALGMVMYDDDGYNYAISSGHETDPFSALLEVHDPLETLQRITLDYTGEHKPTWVSRIEESLFYMLRNQIAGPAVFALAGYQVSVLSILEDCLNKWDNACFTQISQILVESRHYTDRSQFIGTEGWTAMVTAQGIEYAKTQSMVDRFRQSHHGQQREPVLAASCQVADVNHLDGEPRALSMAG